MLLSELIRYRRSLVNIALVAQDLSVVPRMAEDARTQRYNVVNVRIVGHVGIATVYNANSAGPTQPSVPFEQGGASNT